MPKILWKDLFVEIRHSMGRYLSILAIVALGVSFFAGIKASAPDMKHSADTYFDKYNVQDIQIYSTIGMRKDDLKALEQIEGVEEVQGQFSSDYLAHHNNREMTIKLISYQEDQTINVPRLVEGRMPQNDHECVFEADGATGNIFGTFELGETISLYSGTDTPASDDLNVTTFTIVGKAYSPNYLSYNIGSSSIGSGTVDSFVYVPQAAIKADYFTEADLTVVGARDEDMYSDDYFNLTDPVVEKVEALADTRIEEYKKSLLDEVEDKQKEADKKLADAQKKLDDAKKQLDEASVQIADGKSEIYSNENLIAQNQTQLNNSTSQLQASQNQLNDGLAQINDGISQLEQSKVQLEELKQNKSQLESALGALPQLNQAIDTLQNLMNQLAQVDATVEKLQASSPNSPLLPFLLSAQRQLQEGIDQLITQALGVSLPADQALTALQGQRQVVLNGLGGSEENGQALLEQVNGGIAQIEQALEQLPSLYEKKKELESSQAQIDSGWAAINSGKAQLAQGQAELASGKKKIEDAQNEYDQGLIDYQDGLKEYEAQKADAQKQIDDAKKKINDLDAEWIVLDRDSHYSYRDYESCADRMDGIASVFPVFFYLVAALVCMTTMTRMVDEQRNEMGTLKALGYSRNQISAKYLIYAGSAALLGSIIGCAIGMIVFPYIIFTAWNTMYNLEQIHFTFPIGLILQASLSVIAIVLGATWFSIYREMREVPAQLMRPKAAKAGKRILLERAGWFWSKLSFMHKVTLRNLFRYKKRFFMTVIGITGCSALLLAGFGLNDSISDIVPRQFGSIYHYDATLRMEDTDDPEKLAQDLAKVEGVQDTAALETLPVTVRYDHKDVEATLNIVDKPDQFEPFMSFNPMDGSDEMKLDDSGALLSVKTAEKMGLKTGDTLTFKTGDHQEISLPVTGIFEQYTGHQIFITQKTFKDLGIKEKPATTLLLVNEQTDPEFEADLGTKLMNRDDVRSVTFYSATIENFENMISSIKMVVVVLVLSAAMLAFVVLYNLSNVNISERLREIATIKVLGFTEKEVNAYINHETIILALIGSIVGLVLGVYLHDLIMSLAELDTIRFGRTIFWQSYVYSVGLTMLFTLLVNWIMKYRLRKIQMVESLKAIE